MRFPRKRGSTSVMIRCFVPDNSVTTGAGCTGLTNASGNLAISFSRELQNGGTELTGANILDITTIGAFSAPATGKIGFKAVDAAKFPGLHEIHFADDCAAFGTGDTSQAVYVNIYEKTSTALKIGPNMVLIPLVPWDYQDGVRMGMTALPAAIPGAANGLQICGTNADTTYGNLTVTGALTTGSIVNNGVLTQTGAVTLSSTLATGAVTLSALTVTNNLIVSGTTTLTGNVTLSGTLGTGAVTLSALTITNNFLVSGTSTQTGNVTLSGTLTTGAATLASLTSTGAITGNITGNVSGSVGSVTGAVTLAANQTVLVSSGTGAGQVSLSSGLVALQSSQHVIVDSGNVTTVTGNVNGSVASVTGNVSVGTNYDKTAYALTQSFPTNFGNLSITPTTGLIDLTQTAADKVWGTTVRVLTAGTNIALAKGTGVTGFNDITAGNVASVILATPANLLKTDASGNVTVGTNNDKAGYSISGTKTTLDSLNDITAAAVGDEVLEELVADHKAIAGSLAAVLNDMLNRSCGKVVIDRDNNTIKVYDTNGSSLMFTLTMGTVGNVDTLTRT